MTATDELRRMLDERGVEYETYIEQPTGFEHVKWNFSEHGSADFNLEFGKPWLTMYGVISGPEQAIAATLGAETCQIETTENWLPAERYHRCNHCGAFFAVLDASGDIPPHYCPNCGRKVVDA